MTTKRAKTHLLVAAAFLAGCGSSERSVKAVLTDSLATVRQTQDYEAQRADLRDALKQLRSTRDGEARRLAIRGFEATLRGVEARIDFVENDSGNVAAATRDARRADLGLGAGARLLRAAGRLLEVRVGRLNGY